MVEFVMVGFVYAQPAFQVIEQARCAAIDGNSADAVTSNYFSRLGLLSGHHYIAH